MTSLYFFGKKENVNREKDVIFDNMDDPTYIVVAIEEFANINKDHAVSALDGFVDKKMMTEIYFLIKFYILCDISGKVCLGGG